MQVDETGRKLSSLNSACYLEYQKLNPKPKWNDHVHFVRSVSGLPFDERCLRELGFTVVDLFASEAKTLIVFPNEWKIKHTKNDSTYHVYAPSGTEMFTLPGSNNVHEFNVHLELINPENKSIPKLFADESLPNPLNYKI